MTDNIKLDQLYKLTLDRLIESMSDSETATPGMIQGALRFLADNNVSAVPVSGSAMPKLEANIPFPRKANA